MTQEEYRVKLTELYSILTSIGGDIHRIKMEMLFCREKDIEENRMLQISLKDNEWLYGYYEQRIENLKNHFNSQNNEPMTSEEEHLHDLIKEYEQQIYFLGIERKKYMNACRWVSADKKTSLIIALDKQLLSYRNQLARLQSKNTNMEHNHCSNELKITKEKVREAAAKCSTADATLRTLFPEAFEENAKYYDLSKLRTKDRNVMDDYYWHIFNNDEEVIGVYAESLLYLFRDKDHPLHGKAFGLSKDIDWEIKSIGDRTLLIPTRKNK